MESSQFSDNQSRFDAIEQMESQGGTCDTFRVKLYGKLHFLKRLKAEYAGDIRYQEAFRKEFETGYRLEHPNLVRYLSLDKDGILMEYVDGETLSQRLTKNPDYFKQRKNSDKLIRQLLSALQYLHNHQVLHLDLKPDNILLTRLPNALFDAWTVILTYRIAKRNFGEKNGRIAAIFTILMPQMLFYAGVTMKESMMLMLTMWALERGDKAIRQKDSKVLSIIAFVLLSLIVSFFRTALAWVLVLAFICALVFSSDRIMKASRRWTIILTIALAGVTIFGGTIIEQTEDLLEQVDSEGQNFEYRANRKGGNTLVSKMSKAVFAPIMFTLPFPTMVEIEGQNIQQLQNGGFYLKNILSFFCVFALVLLLITKKWRGNVLIIAFLLGYLMVLALSSFAQSGRFHHPVIPMELIFATFGINNIKNRKQASWFDMFLAFEFVVIIAWNWFKLKGRGLM